MIGNTKVSSASVEYIIGDIKLLLDSFLDIGGGQRLKSLKQIKLFVEKQIKLQERIKKQNSKSRGIVRTKLTNNFKNISLN